MVLAAGRQSAASAEALNQLCAIYWYPVYAYTRRKGYRREEAEDLTQAFFARILEHNSIAEARRERGKFRSFLLASMTNFLANEWDRARAQKRGGDVAILTLDFGAGEEKYHREPSHDLTPEALFEKHWALALLEEVLGRLRQEFARKGQATQFDRLKIYLTGDQERGGYQQLAADLKTSESAVKVAVYRLRRRYAELLREAIAATVVDPVDVDGEIQFLYAALE